MENRIHVPAWVKGSLSHTAIKKIIGTKYSRMDQVKFLEDSLYQAANSKFHLVHSWILCPI